MANAVYLMVKNDRKQHNVSIKKSHLAFMFTYSCY